MGGSTSNSLMQMQMAQQQSLMSQGMVGGAGGFGSSSNIQYVKEDKFKIGDLVEITYRCTDEGKIGRVTSTAYNSIGVTLYNISNNLGYYNGDQLKLTKPKEKNMLKSVASDLKDFIKEHKSVIYAVAVLMLVDHLVFDGAFREKLKGMMNKLIGKVEAKLDEPRA